MRKSHGKDPGIRDASLLLQGAFLSGEEDTCLSAGKWDRHQRSSWDNRSMFIFLLNFRIWLVQGQKSTLGIRPVEERLQEIWDVRYGGGT